MSIKLTMGELRDVQKTLGIPADRLEEDPFGLVIAQAWIAKRRVDPSFTFEQACELLPEEVAEIVGVDDPKD